MFDIIFSRLVVNENIVQISLIKVIKIFEKNVIHILLINIDSFVNSNNNTRYLYISSEITNVIKFSLFKCIRNLLKIIIIFNRIKYLQSCILIKISSINKIK